MPPPEKGPSLDDAVRALKAGKPIGLPTETVYGLAADATNDEAVAEIFRIKGRPQNHPLILHLAEGSWLPRYCARVPDLAYRLAEEFWPGALTLILQRGDAVSDLVTGGLSTVAVRVPAHPLALAVLRALGAALAAPSANRFGAVSPTTRQHVLDDLGDDVALVLEGGPCVVGLESTILDLTRETPRILRPGGITKEALQKALGSDLSDDDGKGPAAPGTLASHYCPRASLQILHEEQLWSEALRLVERGRSVGVLSFGSAQVAPSGLPEALTTFIVSGDPKHAAHRLYAGLRHLDASGCDVILTILPSMSGIGAAVVDRILRAAAGSSRS